jgi:acyl carrier protein
MSSVTAAEVRAFLLDRYAEGLSSSGVDSGTVSDEFDLLTEGVIDSFGILEMIAAMQERFGIEVDFESIDPQDLTVIGPLSRFVESQAAASNQGG